MNYGHHPGRATYRIPLGPVKRLSVFASAEGQTGGCILVGGGLIFRRLGVFCVSANGLPCRIGFSVLLCLAGSLGQALEPESVVVFPPEINLLAKGRQQVVVQQRLANGLSADWSREAVYASSDPAVAVVEQGVVRAQGEGLAKLRVEAAGQVVNVDLFVGAKRGDHRLSFLGDVLPVLGRAGCAGGSCHAKPKGAERIFHSRCFHSTRRLTTGRS